MKKPLLYFLLIIVGFELSGQDLKARKENNGVVLEQFFIDKTNKTKEGPYFKILKSTKDTLVTGQFLGDKKVGLWKLFDESGKLMCIYNFDLQKLAGKGPGFIKVDAAPVYEGDQFVDMSVSSPAYFLGTEIDLGQIIREKIKMPTDMISAGIQGVWVAAISIDEEGNVADTWIESGPSAMFDNAILKSLSSIPNLWFPAYRNGKPVKSKVYFVYEVLINQELDTYGSSVQTGPHLKYYKIVTKAVIQTVTSRPGYGRDAILSGKDINSRNRRF
ncbi:MAG: energy transducer TonB [Saprospiraceae bacterium]|nr:energy transducer TonB [Saprospiraceae bacterium]